MKLRKFVADDMKDALTQIKRDLGPDAMIVATRPVRRGLLGQGVEVTAAVDVDEAASKAPTPLSLVPKPSVSEADLERIMAPVRSELRSLRSHLRSLPQNDSDGLRKELSEMRRSIDGLRDQAPANDNQVALSTLAARHQLAFASNARLVALVGMTGVGKTTTIAKLAAKSALVERRSVAIVTLDGYRVGGEDQMRAYADLIGVPLHVATPAELAQLLPRLASFERIFIDTAGRSPRDAGAIRALAEGFAGLDIEIHLALPAGSSRTAIDACAARMSELRVARLLFTKVDEAERLDEVVRAPARLAAPVTWVTTGQRVPEDIESATPERLLELATFGFALMEQAA
jgi:flagellar biosynthesis protein FlhF